MFLKEQSYVVMLADTGSMSLAAEKLFISQPALSAYIKALEERMGPLFVRKEGVYVPTYLGEIYLAKARQMLALQDSFNLDHSLINRGVKGRIRIGIQTRRSPIIIGGIIKMMLTEYPQIEPIIEEGNYQSLYRMLTEQRIDMMICSVDQREPNLSYRLLSNEKLLLVIHEGSQLAKGAVMQKDGQCLIDLCDAKKEMFILQNPDQSIRMTCDKLFEQSGFFPEKYLLIRNIEAAIRLVSEGIGVAFNRSGYVGIMSSIPHIIHAQLQQKTQDTEYVIAYLKYDNPSVQFIDLLDRLEQVLLDLVQEYKEKL